MSRFACIVVLLLLATMAPAQVPLERAMPQLREAEFRALKDDNRKLREAVADLERRITALEARLLALSGQGARVVSTPPTEAKADQQEKIDMTFTGLRGTTWGMTLAAVRDLEGKVSTYQDEKSLAYDEELDGYTCTLVYLFNEGSLYGAAYTIDHTNIRSRAHFDTYMHFWLMMGRKYGKQEPTYKWTNERFKDEPAQWGQAIADGDLTLTTRWTYGDTVITHSMGGDNLKLLHRITYVLRKGAQRAKKDDTKEAEAKL